MRDSRGLFWEEQAAGGGVGDIKVEKERGDEGDEQGAVHGEENLGGDGDEGEGSEQLDVAEVVEKEDDLDGFQKDDKKAGPGGKETLDESEYKVKGNCRINGLTITQ